MGPCFGSNSRTSSENNSSDTPPSFSSEPASSQPVVPYDDAIAIQQTVEEKPNLNTDTAAKVIVEQESLFEYMRNQLDIYLDPIRGTPNVGNTCFMNAILNSLYFTYTARLYFLFEKKDNQGLIVSLLKEFMILYQTKDDGLSDLLRKISQAIPKFSGGLHYCAASYLQNLLQTIDEQSPNSAISWNLSPSRMQFADKLSGYCVNKNVRLHELFSVYVENVFTCTNCYLSYGNPMYARMLSLPIPIHQQIDGKFVYFSETDFFNETIANKYRSQSSENLRNYSQSFQSFMSESGVKDTNPKRIYRASLQNCFHNLCRASLMTPGNESKCKNCKSFQPHYKQTFLRHTGDVLVINLQRYDEFKGSKLETEVRYDEKLDMGEYIENGEGYRLKAVVNHFGDLQYGHYTTDVKAGQDWLTINDARVKKSGEKDRTVLSSRNAVLLFYEKYSTRAE